MLNTMYDDEMRFVILMDRLRYWFNLSQYNLPNFWNTYWYIFIAFTDLLNQ